MNNRLLRHEQRGQRSYVFMDAQAEDFPADGKGGTLAARLKELLTQAAELDMTRAANANKRRQGTEGREGTRVALRRMVKTAWDTYKTISRDRTNLKGLFESPSKIKNDHSLVTTARVYADTAATLAGLFAEYGLAATFFVDMRAKADSIGSYIALQNAGTGAGVDTTAALEETIRQMDEVIESLDTVVTNKYRDDPAKLAAWKSASRVERGPRSKPADEEAPPPPPEND